MSIRIGQSYTHYKHGNVYTVIALARMEANPECEYVVYRAEYADPDYGSNATWIRPLDEFMSTVEWNGKTIKRFTPIE